MADHSAAEVAADAAPLEGVVIIDLSLGMAGPFAASRLADLGARVIKVEPLSGDPARGYGPAFVGPDAADSAVFAALNRPLPPARARLIEQLDAAGML